MKAGDAFTAIPEVREFVAWILANRSSEVNALPLAAARCAGTILQNPEQMNLRAWEKLAVLSLTYSRMLHLAQEAYLPAQRKACLLDVIRYVIDRAKHVFVATQRREVRLFS